MAVRTSICGPRRLSSALSSAVFEWILILFLFVEASFSFLVTRFSRRCKLQTPCILCSRLDHVLGSEKPGFYRNLICNNHKLEISSLAFCHLHQKLAHVSTVCEACLLSFGTRKKSNYETYGLLVGKLGLNIDHAEDHHSLSSGDDDEEFQGDDVAKTHLLKDDMSNSAVTMNCSCCSNPFRHKPHAIRLLQDKTSGVDVHDIGNFTASLAELGDQHHESELNKTMESSVSSLATQHTPDQGFDRFSNVEYTEVKITSDSESEVPLSHDDNENALTIGADNVKEAFASICSESEPIILVHDNMFANVTNNIASEKLIHSPALVDDPSGPVPEEQLHDGELHEISAFSSPSEGPEQNNLNLLGNKTNPSQSQMTPPDEEVSNTKDTSESRDVACITTTSTMDVTMDWSSNEVNLKTSHSTSESGPSVGTHMDLNDAYKLAVGTRESSMSPTFADIIMKRDSSKIQEDLKLLISQISAARGIESPWHEMSPSPRVYGEGEESILQNISKRLSIDRNESGLESLDGSIVSEMEGESAVERLRRQIELDRKSISLLYKELEEERNASAIAANQAMALITKLQEEKAAMQMEALQYQRMMEEQAEYDQEALQRCNEQLTEKEKQIQDLEAEVESFKNRFIVASSSNKVLEQFSNDNRRRPDEEGDYGSRSKQANILSQEFRETGLGILENPLLYFKDEKAYLADYLTKLEKKLHLFSNNGVYLNVSNFDIEEEGSPNGIYLNAKGEGGIRYGVSVCDMGINGQFSDEAAVTGRFEHPREEAFSQENSQIRGFFKEDEPDGTCLNAIGEDCIRFNTVSESDVRINGLNIDEAAITGSSQHPHVEDFSQEHSQAGESLEKIGSSLFEERLSSVSVKGAQLVHEKNENCSKNKKEFVDNRDDLGTLDNEVAHLRRRLEALEFDRDFLEHAINSLRNGDDGLQFIQEIASDLRELRRIGIMRRKHLRA